jgi:hypothetical protein
MVNRSRRYTCLPYEIRRGITRSRLNPLNNDIHETIIIHSDSEEEENRINDEIRRLKRRMDDLDEEKRNLFIDLAKKYQERERVRTARQIRINNNRLRREFESRLLPRIETVATCRQSIINGARTLFDEIDINPTENPPSYESLFTSTPNTSINTSTNDDNNVNNNNNNTCNDSNNNDNDSDSDFSFPDVDTIFNNL